MTYIEFPKWKYHRTKDPCTVQTIDEEQALGKGWYDSPADIPARERRPAADAEPEASVGEDEE